MRYLAVTYNHSCGLMIQTVVAVPDDGDEEQIVNDALRECYDHLDDKEFKEFVQDRREEFGTFEIHPVIGKVLAEKWDEWDHIEGFNYGEDSDSQASFGGHLALIRMLQMVKTEGEVVGELSENMLESMGMEVGHVDEFIPKKEVYKDERGYFIYAEVVTSGGLEIKDKIYFKDHFLRYLAEDLKTEIV